MTRLHSLSLITLAALGALGAAPTFAQGAPYSYFGIGGGQSRGQIDAGRIAGTLVTPGSTVGDIQRQNIDISYKVFGGYQFNNWVALEAGFFSLGEFGFKANTSSAAAVPGTIKGNTKLHGLNLDLVGSLPLTDKLTGLARVGAQYARTRGEYSGTGANALLGSIPSQRETNVKVGLGLQYAFNPSFMVRAEVERYRVSDAMGAHDNVNVGTLSAVFPFGRAPMSAPRAMATPAYTTSAAPMPAQAPVAMVQPAPAAAPLVVAAAAPAPVVVAALARRRVSFSADSLFGFDQSTVNADSKPALDSFAKQLQGTQFDTIQVEGHTDRLGSAVYNQTLSQQRADAVKAYLVAVDGVQGDKINAVGKGETTPMTKAEDCKGSQPTAKLISCLQPDRRMDVEVVGSR